MKTKIWNKLIRQKYGKQFHILDSQRNVVFIKDRINNEIITADVFSQNSENYIGCIYREIDEYIKQCRNDKLIEILFN